MGYNYQNLIPILVSTATNLANPENERIDAAKKLVGRFLQSSMSSDEVMRLVDLLASGMSRLANSGRKPPNPVDLIFTDYVIEHLANLFVLMSDRLEEVSFKGSTPHERREADQLIADHFLNDKEDEVYESIREADLDDLIDLIINVSNGHDFMLGKQASQMFNHPQTAYLDVPVYMMSQLIRAIGRRMGEVTKYTPPLP